MLKHILFGLAGGLGMFIFGMRMMSTGLKDVAGERLKKILGMLTKNRVVGLIVGTVVTILIQSSSATTVMVVGFTNAGLLTLKQAISVVLGANIGTTITAWVVSALAVFKITDYALPSIGVGFLMTMGGKRRSTRKWGEVLMGFGFLFMGIHFLKEAFSPLQQSDAVKNFMVTFGKYPILGVLAGTLVTMLLQSSSATIALLQVLAFQGVIDFKSCIPIVLGDNIGTTITAQIAAIGANRTAKRAAMAHTMFNVIGVCYMLPLVYFGIYEKLIHLVMPGAVTTNSIMAYIAATHSIFNVFNAVLVFLPALKVLEKVSTALVPDKPGEITPAPRYLEKHLLDTPAVALQQSTKELIRMIRIAQEALHDAYNGFINNDETLLAKVAEKEETVDNLQREITGYLVELSMRDLSLEESEMLPVLLHSVNDAERIGDHAENLVELAQRSIEQKQRYSEEALHELKGMFMETNFMIEDVLHALENLNTASAIRALKREEQLNRMQTELAKHHVDRLQNGKCDVLAGVIFMDFVDNLEKVGDHLTNIAQGVMSGLRWGEKYRIQEHAASLGFLRL